VFSSRAAGGVVVDPRGRVVVVRQRSRTWSLPKGHLEDGEGWEDAARREVEEETGMRGRLGRELDPARYRTPKGRDKTVRYWVMDYEEGEFAPNDEVDELRWLAPGDALALLSYPADRRIVEQVR
jgi:8-oxo-dGTP diphosphatase